ncbi:calponin [Recurvomyces mirabilis]|uniref:Calponin n=1 Tax=Recurvomyces mirabilis TaxID=574656 RepID=A0AAE1C5M4_9PEZI|nr:calponin [Recurvomyces mirabilis]KAK5161360.1 calponin [Recurvomyces mirabilis]
MASVSSLDQDMRNLRMSRYTPQAAKEVRTWIEETLGEQLPPGDLLEVLKDGVALCKLANMALPPPGVKFKSSQMPFIQMENISHFLRACEAPSLSLPAHDRFLTVDLYEAKDPAQVLQCLGAFSRKANAANPSRFRSTIGPKKSAGVVSPSSTGGGGTISGSSWRSSTYGRAPSPTKPSAAMPSASRALSPSLTGGSNGSQGSTKSPGPTSSWSSRKDEGVTSPAWNIHQYGYMGGASQGNQGISFGARRQITSQSPSVPSMAEKERKRREKAEEDERLRQQVEEAEHKRRKEREAEEEQDRVNEERRWEEETRRLRDEERRRVDEQKRQWEAQDRKWKEEEEARRKEDADMKAKLAPKKPPERPRVSSSSILRGQSLAQYQREQAALASDDGSVADETPEQRRVRELEQQLEEARERERQYQVEREERLRNGSRPSTARTETPRPESARDSEKSFVSDERDYLRQQWQSGQNGASAKPGPATSGAQRPLPSQPSEPQSLPLKALPQPNAQDEVKEDMAEQAFPPRSTGIQQADSVSSIAQLNPDSAPTSSPLGSSNRPLPTPEKEFTAYSPQQPRSSNRTDQYLSMHTPPSNPRPRVSSSQEAGDTSLEQATDRDRRIASQTKTKAGGWASKSLLEREMERERERQREWEANQEVVKAAPRDPHAGTGEGQSWDVNQYGYTGGDGMNKGSSTGSGINFGGRRQIIGPRPQK